MARRIVLSKLKHNLCALLSCNIARLNLLMLGVRARARDAKGKGHYLVVGGAFRGSTYPPFCHARLIATDMENGSYACTSTRIASFNPLTKQPTCCFYKKWPA